LQLNAPIGIFDCKLFLLIFIIVILYCSLRILKKSSAEIYFTGIFPIPSQISFLGIVLLFLHSQFQVFLKPTGSLCNLGCHYCYYLKKEHLYPRGEPFRMPEDLLETYIIQQIEASPGQVISFSWHGGEPILLGLDYFKRIVQLQQRHKPRDRIIRNGIQTNGTLLNEAWCRFFAEEKFMVGLSLDGPAEMHNRYRLTKAQKPTHKQALRGYKLLRHFGVPCDILCVVNAENVRHPLQVYRFFKEIKAQYIGFLPLVEPRPELEGCVSHRSVPAVAWGDFLSTVYDEWLSQDVGRVKVQIFEEAARTAFGQEHSLCIFRPVCGDIPVVEHNGDFYTCDHFVNPEHRLGNIQRVISAAGTCFYNMHTRLDEAVNGGRCSGLVDTVFSYSIFLVGNFPFRQVHFMPVNSIQQNQV